MVRKQARICPLSPIARNETNDKMRLIRLIADIYETKNRVTESETCEETIGKKRNEAHFLYILPSLKIPHKKSAQTRQVEILK